MTLQVHLLFHFNQHINEHARLASQVCYRGLLRVLLNHPSSRYNLHISGTLLNALAWLDPEPIHLIRTGLANGQFELLGSTYAQNIPYATDDRDNADQIQLHREILKEFFDVRPTTFWNPERCWRQSLVPLITSSGYDTTLVESHILEASGAPAQMTYLTRSGEASLKVVRDEEKLIDLINFGAWFGDSSPALRFLTSAQANGARSLAYAEDAEAMGLWGYGKGLDPQGTWDGLDRFLTGLEALDGVQTAFLCDAPASEIEVTPILDGSASWMDASLQDPALPYHEHGYKNWFDFNNRSEKLIAFRNFYSGIRGQLAKPIQDEVAHPGSAALRRLASQTYLAHQYEFGCIGIGHDQYRGWKGAQAALVLDRASRWAVQGRPFAIAEDVNGDGVDEYCLSDGKNLLITTPLGGRLLYWIDMELGKVRIGSPLAIGRGPHYGDAAFPETASLSPRQSAEPDLEGSVLQLIEPAPTRMAPFLAPWIWEELSGPFSIATLIPLPHFDHDPMPVQMRGFADEFRMNDEILLGPGSLMQPFLETRSIVYTQTLGPDLFLEKRFRLARGTVEVDYAWSNTGQSRVTIIHQHCSEINLDAAALLSRGPAALVFTTRANAPALQDPTSGETIVLKSVFPAEQTYHFESLLAHVLGLRAVIDLYPGVFWQTSLSLSLER